jgi:hypothetical protein
MNMAANDTGAERTVVPHSRAGAPPGAESPEARRLAANYASEGQPGARYAGQWVVVRGEGIEAGADSAEEIAAYVRPNYQNPAEVAALELGLTNLTWQHT